MYAKFVDKDYMLKLVNGGAMLVDMRSPVEYRNGTIEGAVNLPLKNFLNTITGMPKNSKIIVFSTSTSDSDLVAGINYAMQLGFDKLFMSEYDMLI